MPTSTGADQADSTLSSGAEDMRGSNICCVTGLLPPLSARFPEKIVKRSWTRQNENQVYDAN